MSVNRGGMKHKEFSKQRGSKIAADELPESIDWRAVGSVSPVKNQGSCGSCYSFAAAGALESHWKLYSEKRNLPVLSEQEIVDCSWVEKNEGCKGGLAVWSYDYIVKNGRLSTSKSYPYIAKDSHCQATSSEDSFGGSMASYAVTEPMDENDMKHAIATQGPISIHLYVVPSFQSFR